MQMAVAERGLMVLDCTAVGKSGHAARGEGVNAIYEALPAIEWFRSFVFPKVSPWLGPVGMSVTMIQAGTQHNVVPDTCTFVVDVRPNGMYANPELLSLIQAAQPCSNQTLCSLPTLKIGPGASARSHTADEFIRLSEIREGIGIFVRLLDQLEL